MTKAYVREYTGLVRTEQSDSVLGYEEPGIRDSVVDYTAAAAALVFLPTTRWVVVRFDSIASYVVSDSVTATAATTANMRVAAGEKVEFAVPVPATTAIVRNGAAQKVYQISAITNT